MGRIREINDKFKVIYKIWKEGYKVNPRITYYEIMHGVVAKLKIILEVFLPAIIVNFIVEKKDLNKLIILIITYAMVRTLFSLIERSSKLLQEAYGFKSVNFVLAKINKKAMSMDYKDTELVQSLDTLATAKDSVWEFNDVGYVVFNDLLGAMISFLIMSSVIYMVHPSVYIIVIIATIFSVLIERKKLQYEHDLHKKQSGIKRKVNYCRDLLHNQKLGKEIRNYNADKFMCDKYRDEFNKYYDVIKLKKKKELKLTCMQKLISFIQLLIIYIVAIFQYIKGVIPIGSFLLYISASKELFNVIAEILDNILELSVVSKYYKDYDDFMTMEETMRNSSDNIQISNGFIESIEFRNVSFAYPNSNELTLKDINFVINSAEKVAILGENGSGKSTLIKLLLRLYDPTEGTILINNVDIKKYDYDEYLGLFSTVFQDFKIFAYSIKENICFDSIENKGDKLDKVLNDLNLNEAFQDAPSGIDTYLTKEFSDEGIDLSIGQKQRLAIARALYKNGKIFVLDEPTAALDPIQEKKIYNHMNESISKKTALFISHRIGSTIFCNKMIVLKDGQVCEMGNHKELMELNQEYYNMFENQAKYYVECI